VAQESRTLTERPGQQGEGGASPREPFRIPGQPGPLKRYEGAIYGTVAVVLSLIIWQMVAAFRVVPALFLPGPVDTINAFLGLLRGGSLWNDLWVSGQELMIGYGLAIVVGLPLGLLMGWYKRFSFAMDPFVNFFYSMPRVALIPLLIIWFGIGIASKVAVVYLGAFFP